MHWWGADLCRRTVPHIFALTHCKDLLTKCNMPLNLRLLSAPTPGNLAGKFPPRRDEELKWLLILNKAVNGSQTDAGGKTLLLFLLSPLRGSSDTFKANTTGEKKNALLVPPSKLNLTRQTRSCAPRYVCLAKKRRRRRSGGSAFPCSGTGRVDGNIYLTYSPSEHKQASAILSKVIFLPFGLGCTDSRHYSKSQGRDAGDGGTVRTS